MDGIYNINKPQWKTSQQVLNILKGVFKKKKLGHLGTLDPFATGVLPVFVGEATKLIPYLNDERKKYRATLVLGKQTDTLDLSGEVIEEMEVPFFDEKKLLEVFNSFLGPQSQIPPQYSAIKIKGKPAYRYARAGEAISLSERLIRVYELSLISFETKKIVFECEVSRGTYVRSLALNIAQALGTLGYLDALTRLKSGHFQIEDSLSLESLEQLKAQQLTPKSYPIEKLFPHIPKLEVSLLEKERLLKGQWVLNEKPAAEAVFFFLSAENQIFAMGEFKEIENQSYLKVKRGLAC